MAERTDITKGTSFRGPLYVTDPGFDALPTAVDDDSTGTADTADFTLAATADATTNDNFATLAALLDRVLQRLQ